MFFTQNPIGSSATEDLQDNAISFDYAMNSPAALWQDRFGKQHKTVQQALKDVGFKPAGFDFVSGGTLGIGTVIMSLCIGYFVQFAFKLLRFDVTKIHHRYIDEDIIFLKKRFAASEK